MTTTDWSWALYVGAGLGVLLIGIGVLVVCTALAGTLKRVNATLDEVDRQIVALSAPVAQTLGHVGGIADTADRTVARLALAVDALEGVASAVGGTSRQLDRAVRPAVIDFAATLAGISAGLRRLVAGKRDDGLVDG